MPLLPLQTPQTTAAEVIEFSKPIINYSRDGFELSSDEEYDFCKNNARSISRTADQPRPYLTTKKKKKFFIGLL